MTPPRCHATLPGQARTRSTRRKTGIARATASTLMIPLVLLGALQWFPAPASAAAPTSRSPQPLPPGLARPLPALVIATVLPLPTPPFGVDVETAIPTATVQASPTVLPATATGQPSSTSTPMPQPSSTPAPVATARATAPPPAPSLTATTAPSPSSTATPSPSATTSPTAVQTARPHHVSPPQRSSRPHGGRGDAAGKPSTQHHSAPRHQHTVGLPPLDSCAGVAVRPSWIMRRWGRFIAPASRKYRVNAALIAAIITKESEGNPRAWNHASDARGLMQVLHGPWSPRANIDRGTGLFALYHRRFRSLTLALAAYNAGPGTVARYGGVPPFWETQRYVPAVTALYLRYRCAQLSVTRGQPHVHPTTKRRR